MSLNDEAFGAEDNFNHSMEISSISEEEINCTLKAYLWNEEMLRSGANITAFCPPDFDTVSCWEASPAGKLAVKPCMSLWSNVNYDTSNPASRVCYADGKWDSYSNYTQCTPLQPPSGHPDYSFIIYLCGYSLSLCALLIACSTFFYFKEIHCLRNKIHTNLFLTYILSNFCWILSATVQATEKDGDTNALWCTIIVIFRYFHLSTFFCMFVEGLFLFVQVIAAFSVDNTRMKLRHYLFIGWGIPFIIVLIWASLIYSHISDGGEIVANQTDIIQDFTNQSADVLTSIPASPEPAITIRRSKASAQYLKALASTSADATNSDIPALYSGDGSDCPFVARNELEYIYIVPILFVLGLNTIFLIWIMWVVITKLRSTTAMSHENDHQNWKAAKALLVIIPLLGITYLITIAGPSERGTAVYFIFEHVRAFLLSIQGFAVTLPYCFFNTEIRNVVRCHWERYQTTRTVVENLTTVHNNQHTRTTNAASARSSLSPTTFNAEVGALNRRENGEDNNQRTTNFQMSETGKNGNNHRQEEKIATVTTALLEQNSTTNA